MKTAPSLEEALALALQLAPKERLQLIERLASSVERDLQAAPPGLEPPKEHWGRSLLRLLDELGPIELWTNQLKCSGLCRDNACVVRGGRGRPRPYDDSYSFWFIH